MPDWVIKQDSSSAIIFKSNTLVRSQVCCWCNPQSKPQFVIQKGKAVKGRARSGWDGFAWIVLLHKKSSLPTEKWHGCLFPIFPSLAVLTSGNQDRLPLAEELQAQWKSKDASPHPKPHYNCAKPSPVQAGNPFGETKTEKGFYSWKEVRNSHSPFIFSRKCLKQTIGRQQK